MQRLPYNGAPRAHKLRHNVISSSLFNERQHRAAHTFYPGVFLRLFLRSSNLSSPFLSYAMLSSRAPPARPSHPLRELVASCTRCVVKSASNVIHLLIEPIVRVPILLEHHFADRDIVSSVRTRCQSSFLYYARYTSSVTAVFAFAIRQDPVFAIATVPWISVPSDYLVDARFNAQYLTPPVKPNISHTRTLSRNWRVYNLQLEML